MENQSFGKGRITEQRPQRFCAYIRVSTQKQNCEVQRSEILNYVKFNPEIKVVDWYIDDGISAIKNRPDYKKMLQSIALGMYDGVIVMKLDRIGRSIIQLCQDIDFIVKEHKTKCIFVADRLDTSTPEGKMFFQIKASFAEYELNLIHERTRVSMAYAKINGTKSGKPIGHPKKKISDEEIKRLYLEEGKGCFSIAKKVGLTQSSVYMRLKKMGIKLRENAIAESG